MQLDYRAERDEQGNVVVHGVARDERGELLPLPAHFWPVIIVNCPDFVPDGDGGFRRDPEEAVRVTVVDTIRRALGA